MVEPYILTHSGRKITRNSGVPSRTDIALALSRQPRFAGMTRQWWSVVDHSLFVAQIARNDGFSPEAQIAALLHDAHEIMGDIPTPFKTEAQRQLQHELDKKWWHQPYPFIPEKMELVGGLDRRALLAEALVIGPPEFNSSLHVHEHFGDEPFERDVKLLRDSLARSALGVHPAELGFGTEASNVIAFLRRWRTLDTELQALATPRPRC